MKRKVDKQHLLETSGVSKKIRKGDQVMAISGNNKGLTGTVLAVDGPLVTVQGLNICKRHTKPNTAQGIKGGIIEHERPIHVSNLRICVDGTPVKLKTRTSVAGKEFYYMQGDRSVSYRVFKK